MRPSLFAPKPDRIDLTLGDDDDDASHGVVEGVGSPSKRQRIGSRGLSGWLKPTISISAKRPPPAGFLSSAEAPAVIHDLLGPCLLPVASSEPDVFYAPLLRGGRSWALLSRRFLCPGQDTFDALWHRHPAELGGGHLFGKPVTFHRYQQAFGGDYAFSGQLAKAAPLTEAEAPEIFMVKHRLNECLQQSTSWLRGCRYDSCLVNWYDGGKHWIGAHSDDERELVPDAPIFALSWGESRDFKVTAKKNPQQAESTQRLQVELRDGDLVIMGGSCQRTHKHEVPARSKSIGRRISLTFRCFKEHNQHLP